MASTKSKKTPQKQQQGQPKNKEEFDALCAKIAGETSVLVRAEQVDLASKAFGGVRQGRPKKGATIEPFYIVICRATGLSRSTIINDLDIAKIDVKARDKIRGKPLANRTLLLVDLSAVDKKQQFAIAEKAADIGEFKKALYVVLKKESGSTTESPPVKKPVTFNTPIKFRLGGRSYQATLTQEGGEMILTLRPAPRATEPILEGEDSIPTEEPQTEAPKKATPQPASKTYELKLRPDILKGMQAVIGPRELTKEQIHEELERRGWFNNFDQVREYLKKPEFLVVGQDGRSKVYAIDPSNPYFDGTWKPSGKKKSGKAKVRQKPKTELAPKVRSSPEVKLLPARTGEIEEAVEDPETLMKKSGLKWGT